MSQTFKPSPVIAPRLRVLADKKPIDGTQSFTILSGNNYQADQFSVQFALNPESDFSANWWSSQPRVRLTLQAGFANPAGIVANWTTLLVGDCDTIDIEMGTNIVRARGRDLSALFIDSKIKQTYQNQTSSQIATILANAAGLTPNIETTTTLVGTYYRTDHTMTALNQFNEIKTEWDMLVYLAGQEGFNLWVEGTTLNFQPPSKTQNIVNIPYIQGNIPQFGGSSLTLHRAMTLARDVEVHVRSWDSRHKNGFTVRLRGSIQTNAGAVVKLGPPQIYVFVKPDLTRAQAERFAEEKLNKISGYQRTIDIKMPGDLTTNVRDKVRLTGTGAFFNQRYYIDSLTRKISLKSGFIQTFTLKSRSSQTIIVS